MDNYNNNHRLLIDTYHTQYSHFMLTLKLQSFNYWTFIRNIVHYLEIFYIIWKYCRLFRNIVHYFEILYIILKYCTLFWNIVQLEKLFIQFSAIAYTEKNFWVELTFALSLTRFLSHLGSNICKTQDHGIVILILLHYSRDTVKIFKVKNRVYKRVILYYFR